MSRQSPCEAPTYLKKISSATGQQRLSCQAYARLSRSKKLWRRGKMASRAKSTESIESAALPVTGRIPSTERRIRSDQALSQEYRTGRPITRNPGMPFDMARIADIQVNRSAVERRSATLPARRSVKKE